MTSGFASAERFGLTDQLPRVAVSVMSNLAEGSGRTNAWDQAHFSQMGYGALIEVDAQLQLSVDLGYLQESTYHQLRMTIQGLSAAINGLRVAQLKKVNS